MTAICFPQPVPPEEGLVVIVRYKK